MCIKKNKTNKQKNYTSGSVLSTVSGIHGESWNICPVDEGATTVPEGEERIEEREIKVRV